MNRTAAGSVGFSGFTACSGSIGKCAFVSFSLLDFVTSYRLNPFYSFLKSPLAFIVNFNEVLRSQLNKPCEVKEHPLAMLMLFARAYGTGKKIISSFYQTI